jgi:hypothetical protein
LTTPKIFKTLRQTLNRRQKNSANADQSLHEYWQEKTLHEQQSASQIQKEKSTIMLAEIRDNDQASTANPKFNKRLLVNREMNDHKRKMLMIQKGAGTGRQDQKNQLIESNLVPRNGFINRKYHSQYLDRMDKDSLFNMGDNDAIYRKVIQITERARKKLNRN